MGLVANTSYQFLTDCQLPPFTGFRIMMMPIILGRLDTVACLGGGYTSVLAKIFATPPVRQFEGQVGYVTIDEKHLKAGETHRHSGLHVDSVYRPDHFEPTVRLKTKVKIITETGCSCGTWGSRDNGMVFVSSPAGCAVYDEPWMEEGLANGDGGCEHLLEHIESEAHVIPAGKAYWIGGLCIHESLKQEADVSRQLLRLSLPSDGPWFDHYTPSPIGIQPSGPILSESSRNIS